MPESLVPECFECAHLVGINPAGGWKCAAFDRIPIDILARRVDHRSPRQGDRGIQFSAGQPAAVARLDAADRYPVKLMIELTEWDSLPDLLEFWRYIRSSASGGHSFSIEADREEGDFTKQGGWPRVFIDGDGSDKVGRIFLNGEDVTEPDVARTDSAGSTAADAGAPLVAAGVMFVTDDGDVLLLRRSDTGEWAFPGGKVENGETLEEAASRECEEEIGRRPDVLQPWTRRVVGGVDFTTFLARIPERFEPKLNDEHEDYGWERLGDLEGDSLNYLMNVERWDANSDEDRWVPMSEEPEDEHEGRRDDLNWKENEHPRAKDGTTERVGDLPATVEEGVRRRERRRKLDRALEIVDRIADKDGRG